MTVNDTVVYMKVATMGKNSLRVGRSVRSRGMGRPRKLKSGTPTTLSFRIDAEMAHDLDAELDRLSAEGWKLTRTALVTKLLREALDARKKK